MQTLPGSRQMQPDKMQFAECSLFSNANFVMTQDGEVQSVLLDYQTFRKVEEILLDYGLGKAMDEVADDEEVDLDTAKALTGYSNERSV
jgi:hypothetical protein